MADLLALLQSKADEIDNESKRREQELKEQEERDEARQKALSEMRAGLLEKKKAFDEKRKVLDVKRQERDEKRRKAMEATGIRIDVSMAEDAGSDSSVDPEPSPRGDDWTNSDESSEEAFDIDEVLPGDTEKENMKKRRRSTIQADDVEYEKGDAGVVFVGAATLPALINLLVSSKVPVPGLDLDHFLDVFLLTHTNFVQSTLLFEILAKVFTNEYKPLEKPFICYKTRMRVVQVMIKWIERSSKDFVIDSVLRLLIDTWIGRVKALLAVEEDAGGGQDKEQVLSIVDKLVKALLHVDEQQKATKEAKEKEEAERKRKEELRRQEEKLMNIKDTDDQDLHAGLLLKYSPAMIAQQMTIADFKMFSGIEYSEFFHCGWTKENKAEQSPNLVRFIDRFNQLSAWIQTQIVSCETVEGRVELITRLIQIGREFEAMHNFQGMMLINAALNSSPILRLKNTWAALPESDQNSFNELMAFLSHHKNYMVYRNKLQTCDLPLIPFIAIHLSDLTFIDENEDKIPRAKLGDATTPRSSRRYEVPVAHSEPGGASSDSEGSTTTTDTTLPPPSPRSSSSTMLRAASQAEEMLINFSKMELLSKVLHQLMQFQKISFDRYQPSLYLQKYFGGVEAEQKEKLTAMQEKLIYESSLRVEPKSSHANTATMRKRGFSIGRKNAKPPLVRSNSQKGVNSDGEKESKKKKEKKEKVKSSSSKYATLQNPKKSSPTSASKRSSVADLAVVQNPLLNTPEAARNKLRRMSEADIEDAVKARSPRSPEKEKEVKVMNPLMSRSLGGSQMMNILNNFDMNNNLTPEAPRKQSK